MAGLFASLMNMPKAGNLAAGIAKDQRGLMPPPITEKLSPTTQQPERPGLMGWLEGARGEGNTVDRLNMFGAQLQDIWGGGDRAQQIRAAQQEQAAQAQAQQQRAEINKLAMGLEMSPADRLIFNANPEVFLELLAERDNDTRDAAAKFNEVDYLNTARGVYRTGPNPGWQEEFEIQPDLPAGYVLGPNGQMMIDPGYLEGQRALSTARRAPPRPSAPRRSGGASRPAAPIAASGIRWD